MDSKSLSHAKWKCQYHIVFIPKYRKKVLYGNMRQDVREMISMLCKYKNIEIVSGAVCSDHVHLSFCRKCMRSYQISTLIMLVQKKLHSRKAIQRSSALKCPQRVALLPLEKAKRSKQN